MSAGAQRLPARAGPDRRARRAGAPAGAAAPPPRRRSPAWLAEAAIGGGLLGAGALLGALAGHPARGLLAGLALYCALHLYHLVRLARWLAARKRRALPAGTGVWREIFTALARLERQNRKRKKRLHKVAARFEQAAEALPDATVILGADGRVLWFNSTARRLLGLRHPGDLQRPLGEAVPEARLAAYLDAGAYEEPLTVASPVNPALSLSVRVVPYGSDRHLLQARDVTRLARFEAMRRDFVANVSHELRSPLTVIVGYLEALGEAGELAAEWRRPVERMAQQAARMSSIVEDLLRLSRLENDPGGAPWHEIALGELIEAVRGEAAALSAGRHRIEARCPPGLVLLGEHDELYSALANLAFNAVHYTPAGGSVRIEAGLEGGGAAVRVSDTGIGIEAEHLPRLTERFYRVDKARSREVGGTGLGLAIVKHALMRHDALLEVESTPGRGSRFTCRFPDSRVRRDLPARAALG